MTARAEPVLLLGLVGAVFAWSAVAPTDRLTWWLEVAPVIGGAAVLVLSYRRFPLTPLVYRLIFLHALVLMIGGHYTYAEVPAGFWLRDWLELSRNHYDRLGHLMQGLVPAMIAREVLARTSPLHAGRWLGFVAVSIALAFSAFYEMLEWWAALLWGGSAEQFLALQGDEWDTQWDMFMALCGATAAVLSLARVHDRQLARLIAPRRSGGV